jgi:hypothetical protein
LNSSFGIITLLELFGLEWSSVQKGMKELLATASCGFPWDCRLIPGRPHGFKIYANKNQDQTSKPMLTDSSVYNVSFQFLGIFKRKRLQRGKILSSILLMGTLRELLLMTFPRKLGIRVGKTINLEHLI